MVRLETPRGLSPTTIVARHHVKSRILASPLGQSAPRQNPIASFSANAPNCPKFKSTYYNISRQVVDMPERPTESCPVDRQDCPYDEHEKGDSEKANLEPDPPGRNGTLVRIEKCMREWSVLCPDQRDMGAKSHRYTVSSVGV